MFARLKKAILTREMLERHMAVQAFPVKVGTEACFGNGTLKMLGLTNQTICAGILKILIKMASGVLLRQITLNFRCAKSGIARTVILVTY